MDFQNVADSIAAMTCIVSVEKLEDGSCGDVRIVTGNKAYIDSIEHPMSDVELLTKKFTPNSLYTEYLTRDLNFEDSCYKAAVEKKCLHAYAHPDRYEVWFNMTFMPLWPDDGNICYCTYTMEINTEPSSERMSNISGDIAAAVLQTAITLRSAKDFRAAIGKSVEEIRKLCDAENCCILRLDNDKETCDVLGESFEEGSDLVRIDKSQGHDFYKVAKTWKDTISGSNCLIAKDEHDMKVVAERNPVWYKSLVNAGVTTVALFPLKSRDEYLGYMWAVNFDAEQSARIKEILELTTFVLGSEIGNYLMVKRLRVLSSQDMLTGVMNRNEMNYFVSRLGEGKGGEAYRHTAEVTGEEKAGASGAADKAGAADKNTIGVIYIDVNGLKTVNDTQGHKAGDKLIKNAAAALKDLFNPNHIFRAGGDEFVVILTGVTEEDIRGYAGKLHEAAAAHDVSFAVGWSFDEDSKNVIQTLVSADEKMYNDKQKYYSTISEQE